MATTTIPEHFYNKKVADLHFRYLLIAKAETPVFQAAQMMAKAKVSCLFVGEENGIEGFVTDIVLRDKVLAKKLPFETPIKEVMDAGIVSISAEAFLYEALLLMYKTKTRYLLVEAENGYRGWISKNKILSEQAQGPFIFIQSVKQAVDTDELTQKWRQVPGVIIQLLKTGIKAEIVNQVISTITDAITLKIIENVIREMGPAPAKFVFFVMGSLGREELTLTTDQDNAIIYEDKANEQRELVREYFLEFANRVSTDLNRIGIAYCEGDFMAKNPKWTHSLSHWKRNYENWIHEASQETVMKYATFFDCRAIFGEYFLLEELKVYMGQQLEKPSERFYVNLGTNALQYEPPLTFFKGIKTYDIAGERHFDIKKTMTPIVDLARLFALKHRIFETNTGRRIQALEKLEVFQSKEAKELLHAYYYLMGLRLEKQSVQLIEKAEKPSNDININELTKVQTVTLVEIFKVIKTFQLKIKLEFTKDIF